MAGAGDDGQVRRLLRRALRSKQVRRFITFGFVGGSGTVLNTAILYVLTDVAGLYYLLAAAIATETAIISNFFGNHLLTFRHERDSTPLWRRFLSFQAISLITLVGTLAILWLLTTAFGERFLLVWNLIAILLMFLANFMLNSRITWKAERPAMESTRQRAVAPPLLARSRHARVVGSPRPARKRGMPQ